MDYKEVTGICAFCGKGLTDKKYLSYNPDIRNAANNIIPGCDECQSKKIREQQQQ